MLSQKKYLGDFRKVNDKMRMVYCRWQTIFKGTVLKKYFLVKVRLLFERFGAM